MVLVIVGVIFSLLGAVLLFNVGKAADRSAKGYAKLPQPLRLTYDRPAALRASGAAFLGFGAALIAVALLVYR
jgi:hypothetical protein